MTMSSNHERMLRRLSKSRGDEKEYKNQRLLMKFMKKKGKARGHQKDYKKHEFLRFIVETAMKREKMDIDTDDHIDRKLQKKIDDMRERRRPILVDQLQSKKPSQPPLIENEAHFKEVVEVEEENKVVLVSKDVEDDDYEKEEMKKKSKKSSDDIKNKNNGKKISKLPVPKPNEDICNLMLDKISDINGKNPVWLGSKILTASDQNSGLGRLYLPKSDVLVNFLTKEEQEIIKEGIHCRVVDQNGERWELLFKYYDYLSQYAFVGNWKIFLKSFGLLQEKPSKNAPKGEVPVVVPGGKIDLWCFRLPDADLSLSFGLRITRL